MRLAMDMAGYDELRASRPRSGRRGELMGIGISFFTEASAPGPRKDMDILGLGMADGCELRVHPTGKAVAAAVGADAGPGPRDDVRADRRRGDRHPADDIDVGARRHRQQTPFGLGTYGSRSTPVSGAAARWSPARSGQGAG
jgi:carbon-monoxide dehydrogenase large subunit